MWKKRTPLQRANVFIWVGGDGLRIWDKRKKQERVIPFDMEDALNIPYVPRFHTLWERPKYYQTELRKILGISRRRVLMAVPEDVTFVERTALEDFIHAALGHRLRRRRGLMVCPHSVALGRPKGQYIAVSRTCRCYCVALVKDGEMTDFELLDAYRADRFALDGIVRDFRAQAHDSGLKVYYPETEEDWAMMALGKNVPFAKIASMDKKPARSQSGQEDGAEVKK